jgi:hypothetical protein
MTGYGQAVEDGVVAQSLPPEGAFPEAVLLNKGDQST